MADTPYNVLFLCTGNSARSILAESILSKDGGSRFRAFSAGSQPKGEVNPLAITTLESYGYPTGGLRSKSWDELAGPGAPQMHFIFTVCDAAAGEACPVWPGHPATAHWGIDDPGAISGTEIEKKTAFAMAFRYLKTRIDNFVSLPLESIDQQSLHAHLAEIGRQEGASAKAGAA